MWIGRRHSDGDTSDTVLELLLIQVENTFKSMSSSIGPQDKCQSVYEHSQGMVILFLSCPTSHLFAVAQQGNPLRTMSN